MKVIGPRIDLNRLTASISLEICDRIGSGWDEWFGLLLRFKAREGHCLVPRRHIEGKSKLGSWVSVQRKIRDTISAERKKRLDAIGFVWDPFESDWEEGLAALRKFKAREGHCRVPQDHVEGSFRLGSWASNSAKE